MIKSFVKRRWLKYKENKETLYRREMSFCQQGTSLGPFLYNLSKDRVLLELEQSKVEVFAYADDIVLLTNNKKEKVICKG